MDKCCRPVVQDVPNPVNSVLTHRRHRRQNVAPEVNAVPLCSRLAPARVSTRRWRGHVRNYRCARVLGLDVACNFLHCQLISTQPKAQRKVYLRCVHGFDWDVWPRHRPKRLRDTVDAGPDQNQRDEYLMSAESPFTLAVSCPLPSNLPGRHRVFPPADVHCPTRATAQESRMPRRSLASRCISTQGSSSSRD